MNRTEARERASSIAGPLQGCDATSEVLSGLVEWGAGQSGPAILQISRMTPPGLPIPALLHFALVDLLGFRSYGPWEKMAWGVCIELKGSHYAFEYRKFGLRLLVPRERSVEARISEILSRARSLANHAGKFLKASVLNPQLSAGNVTVKNLYRTLDERFRFLRQQATKLYEQESPTMITEKDDNGVEHRWLDLNKADREGGALATAAIDAWFSRTEHFFVLAIAFLSNADDTVDLVRFVELGWRDKFRRLFDLSDKRSKQHYDALWDLRSEWRNPLAHGGFSSGGASLFFHVPGYGALPARLHDAPAGLTASFWMKDSSFAEALATLKRFDQFLAKTETRLAVRWAESGFDVAFDKESRRRYQRAMESEETFDELLDETSYWWDRHANMEW